MAFGNLTDQLAILRRQDLTSTEKFVAVVALSFRNSESGRCNPPIVSDDAEKETLCSRSGYTKQCITKTLASLEAKGVIALKKAIARPSEITFTVNDVYGKQGLPSTTITATVNDVYGKGKQRLPITDKEQIKNRQVLIGDFHPRAEVQGDVKERPRAEVSDAPVQKCTPSPCKSAPLREHIKEQEENSKDTPKPKPAKKELQGSRLTLEELPDEWYSECRRIQPKADPHKVFEEFRDHWISQPGAKGRKSDWTATWRNWCRRINARDLERVGYEPGRAQFMVKPEPVNPFKVTPQNCPPRQKTEEELEAERSFDLFERVLNGEV